MPDAWGKGREGGESGEGRASPASCGSTVLPIRIQPQICCNWAPSIAANLRLYTNFPSILEVELAFPQVARKPPSSDSYTTANMLQRAGADCSKFAVVCPAAATWMRAWLSRIALTRRSRAWEGRRVHEIDGLVRFSPAWFFLTWGYAARGG